jgi:hypothetical protein
MHERPVNIQKKVKVCDFACLRFLGGWDVGSRSEHGAFESFESHRLGIVAAYQHALCLEKEIINDFIH